MKGAKGILFLVSALFVNLVSAYGEQYGTRIGGVYVDTELVFAAVLFLLFFLGLMIATRKMNLLKNDMVRIVISMIISLFGIYGIQKAGIDYAKIAYDIGIEKFLMQYFPLILLLVSIIAMFMWGLGTVLMLWGGIFTIAGIMGSINEDIVYNWELTIMIGVILFLIGLALNRKLHKKIPKPKMPRIGIGGIWNRDKNLSATHLIIGIDGKEYKFPGGQTINVDCGFGEVKQIHLENKGDHKIKWKMPNHSHVNLSRKRGKIAKGYTKIVKAKITDANKPGEIVLKFRGTNDKRKDIQKTIIILTPKISRKYPEPVDPKTKEIQETEMDARFGIVLGGKTYRDVGGKNIEIEMASQSEMDMQIFNEGKHQELIWASRTESKTLLSKTRGTVPPRKSMDLKVAIKETGLRKQTLIIYAKGQTQKGKGNWQQATITIRIPEDPNKKTNAGYGAARFDLFVGKESYTNPEGRIRSLDIDATQGAIIYVKNGGSGGTLTWKAAASQGIELSKKDGKLRKGEYDEILIRVLDPNVKNQKISIFAKRGVDKGARDLIKRAVGKVRIPIVVSAK